MLAAFLRNDNHPALATIGVLSVGVFNVFGDYFFVFTCDIGIYGAGLDLARHADHGDGCISVRSGENPAASLPDAGFKCRPAANVIDRTFFPGAPVRVEMRTKRKKSRLF